MAADQGGPHGDLYRVLGVPREASREDIAQAWRRRARAEHPDTRPRDTAAPGRFRALAEAYHVLGDPARRAAYDRALGAHADPRAAEAADGPVSPGPTSPRPAPPSAGVGVPVHVTVVRRPEPPLRAGPVWVEAPSPARDAESRTADVRAGDVRAAGAEVAEAEAMAAEARVAMLAELAMRYLSGPYPSSHYRSGRWGRSW
jgi:curved DNA-binding protein CbpA